MNFNGNYDFQYDGFFDSILDSFFSFQKARPKCVKELKIIPVSEKIKPIILQFRLIVEGTLEQFDSLEFEYLLEHFYFVVSEDNMSLLECTYKTDLLAFSNRDAYFIAKKYLDNYAVEKSVYNIEDKITFFEISY